ncbi:MAG: D-alanine--D-alanine ligase family protein [Actinomycetota bacterium]
MSQPQPGHEPIRLIVLFGGQSAEHDVSCTSAAHVLAAVDPDRYVIEAIGVTRSGEMVRAEKAQALLEAGQRPDPSGELAPLVPEGPRIELSAEVMPVAAPASAARPAGDTAAMRTVVLPLLHGPMGEDGTVQGLLELSDVAYVGAGVLGSAVAMDKAMAKTVLDAHGIAQTRWLGVPERDVADDPGAVVTRIVDSLGLPCFVKPANMGSSVGVSKASTTDEVLAALHKALRYDEMLVVEEAVVAREIELSVMGNDEVMVSVPGEIVPGADFYDYEDKYLTGSAELIIPAELPPEVAADLQSRAVEAYRALRVEGMARADFLYEDGGRGPLLNELNTIPGFTPISMYPKLWEASGLAYGDLIDRLVDLAIERHDRRSAKRTTDRS